MIVMNGEWSTFERGILENIVDVGARDLRFENIHFACDSITDAGGRVFVQERTCRRMPADDGAVMVMRGGLAMEFPYFECSECGAYVMNNAKYCHSCGSRVVE